jgi:hypothetical protein
VGRNVGGGQRERGRGGRVRESRARFAIDYRHERRMRMRSLKKRRTSRKKRRKKCTGLKRSSQRGHADDDDGIKRGGCE